jgi:hypothetical protein
MGESRKATKQDKGLKCISRTRVLYNRTRWAKEPQNVLAA